MGKEENLKKLRKELEKEIKKEYEECQVFCIMTRIRKALEHCNLKSKFPVLNFYCNWILHTKLDRNTDVAREILKTEDPDPQDLTTFLAFAHFAKQLQDFIIQYSLPEMGEEYERYFLKILGNILVDTPLMISFPAGVVTFQFMSNPTSVGRIGSLQITKKQ